MRHLTQIINGQRGISADTAMQLARHFGTSAKLWLNLLNIHELRKAEREADTRIANEVQPRAA